MAEIVWTDWQSAAKNSIQGTATSQGKSITVTYEGSYIGAQTNGGTNYWIPSDAYTQNIVVDNAPPDSDIVRLYGGNRALQHKIIFSEPVVNPIMAIQSLGQPQRKVIYDFGDEQFSILSSGAGWWGGSPDGSLFQLTPSVLTGVEGNGVIQFQGVYSTITWTVPTPENWHGFQFGFEYLESQAPNTVCPVIVGLLFLFALFTYIGVRIRRHSKTDNH